MCQNLVNSHYRSPGVFKKECQLNIIRDMRANLKCSYRFRGRYCAKTTKNQLKIELVYYTLPVISSSLINLVFGNILIV